MSKIKYELFGDDAEIVKAELSGGDLTLCFPKDTEGFLRMGTRVYKLNGSKVTVPLSDLSDGIHAPYLFTAAGEIALPRIEKRDRLVKLESPTDEEVRAAILRCRKLEVALCDLEKRLSELYNYTHGTTIF